jgi:hypothetical protein
MRLVPEDNAGKITFFTTRLPVWAAAAEEIGVSAEDVAELATLTALAGEAATAQRAAQQTAQAATAVRDAAIERMMVKGAKMIAGIRVCAMRDGQQVYSRSYVSPPADASPMAAPGQPESIIADLQTIGWLALRWQCKNPAGSSGTMYHISRRLNRTGPFEHLAIVGKRKYIDDTLAQGTITAEYEIQAIRSTRKGPVARQSVNFGTDGKFRPNFVPAGQAA